MMGRMNELSESVAELASSTSFSGAVRVDIGGSTVLSAAFGAARRDLAVPNTLDTILGPVTVDGRRMAYHKGKPVDPSDEMPSGDRFENIDQFKELLLKDKQQLARALTGKLLTYATGRAPQAADREAVEAIVTKVGEKDFGLRSLVHEIAQSEIFRTK